MISAMRLSHEAVGSGHVRSRCIRARLPRSYLCPEFASAHQVLDLRREDAIASLTQPTLTISNSPGAALSLVTVQYQISFDAFDRAADQPYLEIVTLVGDDSGVADPAAAGAVDPITVLSSTIVRASMSAVPTAFVLRSHRRNVPWTAHDEDRESLSDRDDIRAVVTLIPQAPVAVALRSNPANPSITDATERGTVVPAVNGFPNDDAHDAIRAAGLVPTGSPANRLFEVVSQVPAGGTVVDRGTTVVLEMTRART